MTKKKGILNQYFNELMVFQFLSYDILDLGTSLLNRNNENLQTFKKNHNRVWVA